MAWSVVLRRWEIASRGSVMPTVPDQNEASSRGLIRRYADFGSVGKRG